MKNEESQINTVFTGRNRVPSSLVALLDWINECSLRSEEIPAEDRQSLASWIVKQHDPARRYLGFPLTLQEYKTFRLFTGERMRTHIGSQSVLGLEANRALLLLDPFAPDTQNVLQATQRRLATACYANGCILGECAHVSVAFLRYLAAGNSADRDRMLEERIGLIRENRDGTGRWKKFPFYYTILALTEMPHLSEDEIRYTATRCESLLRRKAFNEPYIHRRRKILENALSQIRMK